MNNFSKIIHLSPPNLACFASWRESIPLFEYFRSMDNLRELRKLLSIVVHAFSQTALGKKRFACRRTAATETRNISRKDAKAAKVGKNGENHLREYFMFPLRTWRLCALAGGISESETLRSPENLRRRHAMTNMLVLVFG